MTAEERIAYMRRKLLALYREWLIDGRPVTAKLACCEKQDRETA